MGLCPFARRSRELGRVHRPIYIAGERAAHDEPDPVEVAEALAALVRRHRDAEIVLLTFPTPASHAWMDPPRFETFLTALREAWDACPPPRQFYMVSFHPKAVLPRDRALTADSLVSLIRRSPDPVIQCVDAEVLDRVRRQAQASARQRMLADLQAKDPALAALFERSINPDPELSSEIARTNFEAHGQGDGRARLERVLADIHEARDRAYGVAD